MPCMLPFWAAAPKGMQSCTTQWGKSSLCTSICPYVHPTPPPLRPFTNQRPLRPRQRPLTPHQRPLRPHQRPLQLQHVMLYYASPQPPASPQLPPYPLFPSQTLSSPSNSSLKAKRCYRSASPLEPLHCTLSIILHSLVSGARVSLSHTASAVYLSLPLSSFPSKSSPPS